MPPQVITITVDTSEGRRRFGVLADSLKDLTPVLKEFDRYKRGKIAELFETEGHGKWAPRSERSEERGWQRALAAAERAPRVVVRKLRRELGRTEKRLSRIDQSNLSNAFRAHAGRNAVARRAFVLAEFERQVESGNLDVSKFESPDRRLQKSIRGLESRLGRASAKAEKAGKVLGGLSQTVRSEIKNGRLVIDTYWTGPAPAALHEGATVGRGAEIPPRPFFEWEEVDVEYLAILFRERAMLAWRS